MTSSLHRLTHRPVVAAAVLYGVLALVMFAPGLLPGRTLSASDLLWTATPWDSSRPADVPVLGSNRELADSVSQFQPAMQVTRRRLPHVPLWDPDMLGGRPLVADPQAQVFSPFSVPAYVLPFWTSQALIAALKLWVAALGAFALARGVGMRFGGALLAGLVFGFSLWAVSWTSWPHMSVWAFLPWLCLLLERCVRRPGPLPAAGLAAVAGLQFLGGHPASSVQVLAVVVLFWLVRVLASAERRDRLAARLLTPAAALVAGGALAGVLLVPFAELLAHSSDASLRSEVSGLLHQPPRYLLGIFLPDYWGRARTSVEFAAELPEHAYYVAALPLMLAAAALILRPRRERIGVAVVGLLTLAVATGIPPVYSVVVQLPYFSAANNGRFAVVTVLCLAVLAGWGLDDLSGACPARRRGAVLAAAVALLLAPVAIVAAHLDLHALGPALRVAWGFATPTPALAEGVGSGVGGILKLASVLQWLVLAGLAVALVALRLRGRVGNSAWVALAAFLVAADLLRAGMGYNPAIPTDHATQPATGAIRFLQARRPARFAGIRTTAPVSLTYPVPPNVAMRYGIYDARGYVIPEETRYADLWRRAITPNPDCYYSFCTVAADTSSRALRALGVIGVSLLLQNHRDQPLGRFRAAYAGPDARIYANPFALPRAYLVDHQIAVDGTEAAFAATTAPGFSPRGAAVTEERIPGLADGPGGAVTGRARIAVHDPERVAVQTRAAKPSLLVLSDTWYPGWTATVDGRPAPVHRVDYVVRGVPVPAGAHRVELRYEPASWRAGWILSLVALVGVLGTATAGLRRRRARGG
jgi:hypothetical protein